MKMQWEAEPDYWDRSATSRPRSAYWCEGKIRHPSKAEAIANLYQSFPVSRNGNANTRYMVYHCSTCHTFHIGIMSPKDISVRSPWMNRRKGRCSHRKRTHRS